MDLYATLSDALLAFARSAWDGTWITAWSDMRTQLAALSSNQGVLAGISVAQIAAATVSAVFVAVIAVAMMRKRALMNPVASESAPIATPAQPGQLATRWQGIMAHMDSPREAEWKLAVIEADKLVDDALARNGYSGDSFGDRLMNIGPGTLISLDGLWWAHKVRNRLAHETDYFLRYTEARQAIAYYEQTLRELNLL
ncbi:MAG TPA: hypothetical protein VMU12_02190 [Candidatus Paceibacterota bacterium]|nr:hypothetical protein [Candidatus Paceibacterota bacterium]